MSAAGQALLWMGDKASAFTGAFILVEGEEGRNRQANDFRSGMFTKKMKPGGASIAGAGWGSARLDTVVRETVTFTPRLSDERAHRP